MKIADLDPQKPVLTTKFVVEDQAPIIFLSVDNDFDIQVFSAEGADMNNAKVISVRNLIDLDASVGEISDFSRGDKFFRKDKNASWERIS